MIAIVGAGLAGLACARELHSAGRDFLLLEADTRPGGREKSDVVDGFVLDRGFQVILSSYPDVARYVDPAAVEARYFQSGALLWYQGNLTPLVAPFEGPVAAARAVTNPAFPWSDKLRLGALMAEVLVAGDDDLRRKCDPTRDQSVEDFLKGRGFSPLFIERFARPFFGGVLIDNDLSSSAALFLYYLKKFATGRAWIPARGIGAFPEALAAGIPSEKIRYGCRVMGLEKSGGRLTALRLDDGSSLPVSGAVLALDEPSLCRLTGDTPRPPRSVTVVYFESEVALYDAPCLVLPEGRERAVRHFVQLTNVAPELAPPGRHLISATLLNPPTDPETAALREIAEIFPAAKTLRHLSTVTVPYAVPDQPPGFAAGSEHPPVAENVVFAGDWANGASIQSALASGREAALAWIS